MLGQAWKDFGMVVWGVGVRQGAGAPPLGRQPAGQAALHTCELGQHERADQAPEGVLGQAGAPDCGAPPWQAAPGSPLRGQRGR